MFNIYYKPALNRVQLRLMGMALVLQVFDQKEK